MQRHMNLGLRETAAEVVEELEALGWDEMR